MAAKTSEQKRYQRYQMILAATLDHDEFRLADIKNACAEELPAFVTRVVGELEKEGWLDCTGTRAKPVFRWSQRREEFSGSRWIASKIYGAQIPRAPAEDRPRERLLALGAAKLRTAELLAILVRTGRPGESALQAGEKIAARYRQDPGSLADAGQGELKDASPAVGESAYCQIMAGIELGRRVVAAARGRERQSGRIRSTADALTHCREAFDRLLTDGTQEEFHIVTLSTKNEVINTHQISVGLLDQSAVHPREVFRPAIRDAAKSVILVHNHPSGDPTPSQQDIKVTRRLEAAGDTVGIGVLDHIIVARNGAVSVREYEANG
jgi:DNA repair protein RadC